MKNIISNITEYDNALILVMRSIKVCYKENYEYTGADAYLVDGIWNQYWFYRTLKNRIRREEHLT